MYRTTSCITNTGYVTVTHNTGYKKYFSIMKRMRWAIRIQEIKVVAITSIRGPYFHDEPFLCLAARWDALQHVR